jgi:hypothetical protein
MEAGEGACAPHCHPAASAAQDPPASAPDLSDLEAALEGSQMPLLCALPIFSASALASPPSPSQVRASLESLVVGGGGGREPRAHEVSAVSQSAGSLSQTAVRACDECDECLYATNASTPGSLSQTAVRAPCIRVCLHSSHTYTQSLVQYSQSFDTCLLMCVHSINATNFRARSGARRRGRNIRGLEVSYLPCVLCACVQAASVCVCCVYVRVCV